MKLPPDFQFNQNNLQDYIDCPRRFQLRHVLKMEWPGNINGPVLQYEHDLEMGSRFHQMIQQHLTGLLPEIVGKTTSDPDLAHWWRNYLNFSPLKGIKLQKWVEYVLHAPFCDHRLMAKYDVIVVEPGEKIIIIDWKTSAKNTQRKYFQRRIQTRLYPLLIVMAGKRINGNMPVSPDQVKMIYWFSEVPESPLIFQYDLDQYCEDEVFFRNLIKEIYNQPEGFCLLTSDARKCRFCNYRSLCDREVDIGQLTDLEEGPEERQGIINLEFDQIEEIPY